MRSWGWLILSAGIGLCSCSSTQTSAPALTGVSHANANATAKSLQLALPRPIWTGSWRLIARGWNMQSESDAAANIYGSPGKADLLASSGFAASANSLFAIEPTGNGSGGEAAGDVEVGALEFRTPGEAANFYTRYNEKPPASLPGVPGGTISGATNSSACPGADCGTWMFAFRSDSLVIRGSVNCSSASDCKSLAENVALSVSEGMKP
jgi:hypothetical protein